MIGMQLCSSIASLCIDFQFEILILILRSYFDLIQCSFIVVSFIYFSTFYTLLYYSLHSNFELLFLYLQFLFLSLIFRIFFSSSFLFLFKFDGLVFLLLL